MSKGRKASERPELRAFRIEAPTPFGYRVAGRLVMGAIVLGWPAEHIEVIDCDQGQSGASTAERREHSRATGNIARSFL
jgi:hypothetical protein